MNRSELKNILQSAYDRSRWISTLQFLSGKRDLLTVRLSPILEEFNTIEANNIIKTFHQIGTLKTSDGVSLPIFEVILKDRVRIEQNRVGVNEFIKKFIIKDAVKGAIVTFSYFTDNEKPEWRFSFISKNAANDFFAEVEAQETNPKKYTYIFGNKEEHRTAIERLYNLEQSRFRLEDFFEAFNVEPVSKKFFEEYKQLYREFSDFIIANDNYKLLFENIQTEDLKEREQQCQKEIRNFVGRLLGRIVFLYFLQKKNWLGATTTEYKDGSTTFLSDLFLNDVHNQEDFYGKYLTPIFFNALNSDGRKNDEFVLENGVKICIPFLNGGLFEEEQEPKKHRTIKFPGHQFKMLFDFFNSYNFTVYENSPEEHTVAVDPEMLGHIFENLIDYNKDTGTFYTPKEIVQYMTQESLIEYLNTHLEKERSEIENLVKNQSPKNFVDNELSKIDQLLDDVKICDPAIGSGAFPMGMLQEIFNLKALIAYQLKNEFDPAATKQNIIQNSIYGVDLDEGAVEIARLRFWLSLVVDEGMPKSLPNLDYKIMQGNSLLESFRGIDLSNLKNIKNLGIPEQTRINFGDEHAVEITFFDDLSFETLQELVKKYFTAGNTGNLTKTEIKKQINDFIEGKIHFKIKSEKDRFKSLIDAFYKKYNLPTNHNLEGFNLKSKELKDLFAYKENFADLESIEIELISFQNQKERPYFLWHLFFGDVLDNGGFDIVIGNPPYVQMQKIGQQSSYLENESYLTFKKTGDIYVLFYEKAFNLLKRDGVISYVTSNTWMRTKFGEELRKYFLQNTSIVNLINIEDTQIFPSATVEVNILIAKKSEWNYPVSATVIKGDLKKGDSISEYVYNNYSTIEYLDSEGWIILDNLNYKLKKEIENNGIKLKNWNVEFYRGFLTGYNDAFFITEKERNDIIAKEPQAEIIIKPLLRGRDIQKFNYDFKKNYVIFPHNGYTKNNKKRENKINIDEYPFVKEHLDKHTSKLKARADKGDTIYNLRSCAYIEKFEEEKIVWLSISDKPAFALDTEKMYVTAPAYIMTSDCNKYLLAFLNSKIMEWYLDKVSSSTGQGTNQWSKIFVEQLPIPIIEDERKTILEILVDVIVYCKQNKEKIFDIIDNDHVTTFFEEIIDAVIFEIYFPIEMNDKNILVIDGIKKIIKKMFLPITDGNYASAINNMVVGFLYMEIKESEVQQKMRKFVTASPNVLKVILQS
ncbi:Eco57I restriction-modification methylase domain-containing protein [Kaistella jeonii]|uniref:Eco57I restriction-modification methylase domain-containing protein n=1 Tax=Kaistella jeonii TaxID=266749 RepID=UPI00068A79E1|nr:TaqI-like C-terminal specificity domain-containing protein [Kaistella jeonii]SFB71921.1 Eco57I restriction-modification methylase [Kaistella jeonii]VEI94927.1 Type IIS restriction enzyme Eco57I [Kaistella jeonii]